jgi:hypothetical protein
MMASMMASMIVSMMAQLVPPARLKIKSSDLKGLGK